MAPAPLLEASLEVVDALGDGLAVDDEPEPAAMLETDDDDAVLLVVLLVEDIALAW